jgi:hypothetical protein
MENEQARKQLGRFTSTSAGEKNTWAGIDEASSSEFPKSQRGGRRSGRRTENRRQINILIKGLDFSLAAFHAEQGEMRPHFPPIEFPSGEHKNMVRSGESAADGAGREKGWLSWRCCGESG